MAEKAREDERMTVDAFLEWDDGTDTRHELIDGRVVAINLPMAPHAALSTALGAALSARVPRGCPVQTGAVRNLVDDWNSRVPDVVVSCTRSEKNWIESPVLVCEIPAPSTARLDVTTKLDLYRALPSVGEILVLRTTKGHVTLWRRSDRQWVFEDFIGSALVPLAATTTPVPLDDLYAPLDFDEPDASADPA